MKTIPLETARRIILYKQMLPHPLSDGTEMVVEAVRRLGGIQYDPLPVVEQAHYLTLWNRIEAFKKEFLEDALYKEKKLVEFVLMRQAMHIVPVEELPYYYQAVQQVFRRGWVQKAKDQLSAKDAEEIVNTLNKRETISQKDFPYPKLRAVFYMGKIAITKRDSGIFQTPHYCLLSTLHPNLDLEAVDEETARKWLVLKTISAYGVASTRHVSYWTGYQVKETQEIFSALEKENVVTTVAIDGLKGKCWITPEDFDLADTLEPSNRVALLSPFDNLTRDRKWLEEMFDYSYKIEYFQKKVMRWQISILHGSSFLGFIDAKINRPKRIFIIKELNVFFKAKREDWIRAAKRIVDFARFHKATKISLGEKSPKWFTDCFESLGYKFTNSLVDLNNKDRRIT